jgi:hypothetical protein
MNCQLVKAVCIVLGCFYLGGCATLLEEDFRKATRVTVIDLSRPHSLSRTLTPPVGTAKVVVAVPNYRCAPIGDTRLTLTVRDANRAMFREQFSLSQLTWSYGITDCDAYGYLPPTIGATKTSEMRFDVGVGTGPLTFEIEVTREPSMPKRTGAVWLVYGGRVPTRELFGPRN